MTLEYNVTTRKFEPSDEKVDVDPNNAGDVKSLYDDVLTIGLNADETIIFKNQVWFLQAELGQFRKIVRGDDGEPEYEMCDEGNIIHYGRNEEGFPGEAV